MGVQPCEGESEERGGQLWPPQRGAGLCLPESLLCICDIYVVKKFLSISRVCVLCA